MRRGTTPIITVRTDRDLRPYPAVVLTLEDRTGRRVEVAGPGGAMTVTAEGVTVKLTQQQTLSLCSGTVKLQLRAVDAGGNAVASGILYTALEDVLKEELIHV